MYEERERGYGGVFTKPQAVSTWDGPASSKRNIVSAHFQRLAELRKLVQRSSINVGVIVSQVVDIDGVAHGDLRVYVQHVSAKL